MRVYAFDPGLTTGVCRARVDLGDIVGSVSESMELFHIKMPNEQVGTTRLWANMIEFEPDRIVGEDFRLFPDVPHRPDPRGTAPDRILAMMDLMHFLVDQDAIDDTKWEEWTSELRLPTIDKQMPGERTVVTDKWLREHKLWRTPKQITGAVTGDSNHAMDALRHLIVYCRKEAKR